MSKQYIVRLVSSDDHPVSREELVKVIRETGHDQYDEKRKQIFDDFYGKHRIDFFGTIVEADGLDGCIAKMKKEFGTKTLGDRRRHITPDIALIYKANSCNMVQHVYEGRLTSDCFQFVSNAKDAWEEVREI